MGNERPGTETREIRLHLVFPSLEKEMATHSSILARRIPWTEEPDGLQSIGLQRAGHDLVTKQLVCVAMLAPPATVEFDFELLEWREHLLASIQRRAGL